MSEALFVIKSKLCFKNRYSGDDPEAATATTQGEPVLGRLSCNQALLYFKELQKSYMLISKLKF